MSGDSQEKTEEPTAKKLRDARKKGQVAQSKDMVLAISLVALVGTFMGLSDWVLQTASELVLLPTKFYNQPFREALNSVMTGGYRILLDLILPFLGVVVFSTAVGVMVQIGVLFSLHPITPDLKKLDPIQGAKNLFKMKNLIELIKSVIKIGLLGTFIYIIINRFAGDLFRVPYCGINCLLPVAGELIFWLMMVTCIAFVIIGVLDYMYQLYNFKKENRMSKDEVKREYKDSEGNPEVKGNRKQVHKELANGDVESGVKKAKVVVTNPTHVAVAIGFAEGSECAVRITAKGKDSLAAFMKGVAREESIPIVEYVPLARALYSKGQVNQYIPTELVDPVAHTLRWIDRNKDKIVD